MSAAAELEAITRTTPAPAPGLWRRQVMAVIRFELRKSFLSRRALPIYLLALLPVGIMVAVSFEPHVSQELREDFNGARRIFAGIYEALILRTVVFFGSAWIFMNLFRGELIDKSLHYYFLAALRRELVVIGKYLSGLVSAVTLFTGATAICFALLYRPLGYERATEELLARGLADGASYLMITTLACLGYGALFLVIGLFFRNPIVPALIIYGWEFINFLLPPFLKKISVIHYLQSLTPVPMSEGPFAIVAEPTPAWLAIPGLLGMTAGILLIAGWRSRRLEIRYGGD